MKRLFTVMLLLALFSPGAPADIIIFRSGSGREGIIEEETPTSVKMRIKDAVIGFSRDNIERIEYSSATENSKLEQKWKEEEKQKEEERRKRRAERKRFEKQQKDKGLEKVGGEWVSRKRKAELRQQGIKAEIRAQKRAEAEEALERERAAVLAEAELASDENRPPKYLKKIGVGKFSVKYDEVENQTVLTGRITNNGILTATSISLEIRLYDTDGKLTGFFEEELFEVGPKTHQQLTLPLDVSASLIGGTEATVTEVEWR